MSGAFHRADNTVSAKDAVTVTTSDITQIPTTRALYVGVSGDITVTMTGNGAAPNQATSLFKNVPVGILPIQVTQVWATGTAASSILALY